MLLHYLNLIFSRLVKEFVIANDPVKIRRILKVLGEDFALSNHPNARKGGAIGLAATAIGLGKVRVQGSEVIRLSLIYFSFEDIEK